MLSGAFRPLSRLGCAGLFDLVLLAVGGAIIEMGVRLRPLPSVARYCRCRLTGSTDPKGRTPLTVVERRRHRIVGMLFRRWPFTDAEGACLRRSLLLGWVLRDRDPILRVGVARGDLEAEITAHAWLEVQGVSIGADRHHSAFAFDAEETA